jgi:hypothetical protein
VAPKKSAAVEPGGRAPAAARRRGVQPNSSTRRCSHGSTESLARVSCVAVVSCVDGGVSAVERGEAEGEAVRVLSFRWKVLNEYSPDKRKHYQHPIQSMQIFVITDYLYVYDVLVR